MGIFAILMGLILANYRRGNDDSILSREAALLMSRVRLAQENTASGQVSGYCNTKNLDAQCAKESDCTTKGASACTLTTPSGGFGMFFSCADGAAAEFEKNHWPDRSHYFMFADRVQCQGDCFPLYWQEDRNWDGPNDAFENIDKGMDHLFSSDDWGSYYKGDTIAEEIAFDPKVTLKDIQLVENVTNIAATCATKSPWKTQLEPTSQPLAPVSANYPLQATIHFPSPDGRSIVLSDNVSPTTPNVGGWSGKPWKEVNLMLALTNRPTVDCRVVKITKDGVISQSTDADCQF